MPAATSSLDIANLALVELGLEPIVSPNTLATTTLKEARHANALYAMCRDEVLAAHPWNCASKRAQLAITEKTITGATAASPVVITSASHGFSNGDFVAIDDIVGMTELNGGRYKVANQATNTFELQTVAGVNVDGSAYTTYVSGGTATKAPAWGFGILYALPTDFIRLAYPEQGTADYRIEGRTMITDETEFQIDYIFQQTDVTVMTPGLVAAIAALLAARLAKPLTGDSSLKTAMEQLYRDRLAEARFADSREAPTEALENFTWVDGRLAETGYGSNTVSR